MYYLIKKYIFNKNYNKKNKFLLLFQLIQFKNYILFIINLIVIIKVIFHNFILCNMLFINLAIYNLIIQKLSLC